MSWTTDEWKGCYPSSWKGMIVPEAMAHPAKFSSKLIRRIYDHMRAEKWVKPGDRVIDPFGGVALGALDAMRLGLEWLGMELEVKFVDLGNHNISNWELKFGKSMPNWGSARLVQGDSRKMLENLGRGRVALSSLPYADSINSEGSGIDWSKRSDAPKRKNNGFDGSAKAGEILAGNYGSTPGQLGAMKDNGESRAEAMISSPPFGESLAREGVDADSRRKLAREQGISNAEHISPIDMERIGKRDQEYGSTPGQLGSMKDNGDSRAAAMRSSPPFGGIVATQDPNFLTPGEKGKVEPSKSNLAEYGNTPGQLGKMETGNFAEAMRSSPPYAETDLGGGAGILARDAKMRETHGMTTENQNYGKADGNLGNMKGDGFNAAISSPPFLQSEGGAHIPSFYADDPTFMQRHAAGNGSSKAYGGADGQLGNMGNVRIAVTDEGQLTLKMTPDFWTAARQIVEQVYLALAPGGHAVWVVKNYVKNKQMVPFSDQWRQLCEAVGFETLHEHRALLVHATSLTLDGKEVHKESKSFFRRLAEKKGSPRIDYETVYCMVKE